MKKLFFVLILMLLFSLNGFAWYHSNWNYRKVITLRTTEFLKADNITTDHIIRIDQNNDDASNFWIHVNSDGNDVRFVASDNITFLSFYFQDFNFATKQMTARVKVTDTFNTSNNMLIYLYYGNSVASYAQDSKNTLTNLLEMYHCDENTGIDVNDTKFDYNATAYAAKWTGNDANTIAGESACLFDDIPYDIRQETLLDIVPQGIAISYWVKFLSPLTGGYIFTKLNTLGADQNYITAFFNTTTKKYSFLSSTSSDANTLVIGTAGWIANKWYHIVYSWDSSGTKLWVDGNLAAFDTTQTILMGNGTESNYMINSDETGDLHGSLQILDEWQQYQIGLTSSDVNIIRWSELLGFQAFGTEEIWTDSSTDVNILGDFNSFGYIKGGSDHNIWFSVFDQDNTASDFLVDFNFSLVPAVGTGSVVFKDLNLATAFVHDTNNLGAGFDVNFYWLYSVPFLDANYFACINLKNKAIDLNYGKCASLSFLVDSTKPSVSWDGNLFWNTVEAKATISLSGHDNNSGIKKIWFKRDLDWQGSANSEVFRSDVNYELYSVPLVFSGDGNFALWFFASDFADWNGDVNKQFVLINSVSPSISVLSPSGDSAQGGTSWTFTFNATDVNDDSVWCDYNVMKNSVAISSYQTVKASGGVCTVSFDFAPVSGDVLDVNAYARDLNGHLSSKVRSFFIMYIPTSTTGGVTGGGGGGGGFVGGAGDVGSFCITSSDCLINLACIDFVCSRLAGAGDMNLVFLLPKEMTTSPFEDVLPDMEVVLSNVSVVNRGDSAIKLQFKFLCSDSVFCAADWCEVENIDSSFVLQAQGVRTVSVRCKIPSYAKLNEVYMTQLVVESVSSGLQRGSNIIIPVKPAVFSLAFVSFFTDPLLSFFGFGLVCFGGEKPDCLFRVGDAPLNFFGLNVLAVSVGLVLLIVLLFVNLVMFKFSSKELLLLLIVVGVIDFLLWVR